MVARPPLGLSRRGLLGLAGLVGLAATGCGGDDGPDDPAAEGLTRLRYGEDHPDQYGDLGRPNNDADPDGLVVLLHGGFWFDQYGLDLMEPIAADLREHGLATWNLEYRRIGNGGGWPTTFADVAAGVDWVQALDLADVPVALLGHSAGGHLAAWAASRDETTPGGAPAVSPDLVVSLSGVLDLGYALAHGVGGGAPLQLLGAGPGTQPDRYALADPARRVPVASPVIAIHATDDAQVPLEESSVFVAADNAAGGSARLVEVPGDHFDLIDPGSEAWTRIRAELLDAIRR